MIPLETISQLDPDACTILLEAIFAKSNNGYAVLDPSFRYVWVSDAFADYSGVPAELHAGRTVSDILGVEAWTERKATIAQAVTGMSVVDESLSKPINCPRSSIKNVRTCYYPLTVAPGKTIGVLTVLSDYSEFVQSEQRLLEKAVELRKEHEQQLIDQEERLKLALKSGKLGTWQLSLERDELIDASAICKATFGYGPDETFGYDEIVKTIHPDDLAGVLDAVKRCRDKGCEYHAEYRCIWRDGSEHWISATAQPTFNDKGKPVTLIGISQDITHRKYAEREKSELLAQIREFAIVQASFLRDVLASVTDGKLRLCQSSINLPTRGTPTSGKIKLTSRSGLIDLREAAKSVALLHRFPDERWQDLITAVSEAGMNAVVHAGGGEAQVFAGGNGCIQVWVTDQGKGIELQNLPRATLEKGYTTTGTMGHGMKMMLQTSDRVWLLTGPAGTTLVIEQDREPLKREWL